MTASLSKQLEEKYPKIFLEERDIDFAHGDGWFWLLNNLCENIQFWVDHNNVPQVIANQIKEKFGGLRFYYEGGNKEVRGMVSLAEHLSYSICERCGETKDVTQTKTSWIKTFCSSCRLENTLRMQRLDQLKLFEKAD